MDSPSSHKDDEESLKGSMTSDSGFLAIKPSSSADLSKVDPTTPTKTESRERDVTARAPSEDMGASNAASFIKDALNLQRNPSLSKANSPMRALSTRSNTSHRSMFSNPVGSEVDSKGSSGIDSLSTVSEKVRAATTLERSDSASTSHSAKSARSTKSVQSLAAIGTIPLGGLRVHDPAASSSGPECLLSGDVVLVTNTKPGMFIGFDTIGLTIGKEGQFRGIREIPSGAHFLFAGVDNASSRQGHWILSKKRVTNEHGDINVKRWDNKTEVLDEELSKAEARIQAENAPVIFNSLLPYASTQTSGRQSVTMIELWPRMTSCIKGSMLTKITGHPWNEWKVSSTDDRRLAIHRPAATDSTRHLDALQKKATEGWESLESPYNKDQVLSFAFVPGTSHVSPEATGALITQQSLDSSTYIWRVVCDRCTHEDPEETVGEMQFTFLTGMLLGNLPCIEQWGWIVKSFFRAYQMAMERPTLMQKIIDTFHAQLVYNEQGLEGSIFDYEPELEKELKTQLTSFKSHLDEMLLEKGADISYEQEAVGKAFEALETYLWKLDWDLRGSHLRKGKIQLEDGEEVEVELEDMQAEDERGEFAPTVVDLNEDGTEQGILRWDQ